MVAPGLNDQRPHRAFKVTHPALAESESKNYQVDFRDSFSQSTKYEGTEAQGVSDKFVTGISLQSHNLGLKSNPPSTADRRRAILTSSHLPAITDFTRQSNLLWLGHHLPLVESRLTTIKKLLSCLSEQVTTFMAVDPTSPAVPSTSLAAIHNHPSLRRVNKAYLYATAQMRLHPLARN